nr:retrotransposon protein, putative, unclassified [Tanacetum cinerariifolium]
MSFFLELQVSQSLRGIFINQSKYALEMLKKYGMESCEAVETLMVKRSKLDEYPQGTLVDPTRYRIMVGSLMHLTASRPDLIFVVCMCVWYQAKPTKNHLIEVLWMKSQLKYYGFVFNKIPFYYDSKSVISLSYNFVQHSRTKHIVVRYHFIKEQVENGTSITPERLKSLAESEEE